ncbi:MAG TPA: penicillin-binding transpeptidase domain-containing protein [Solirubrobacteraceae bacterium]|nr:penicillin-binding transpeptidase domain-containing protein [Solirubrobacteraceae bacterium]
MTTSARPAARRPVLRPARARRRRGVAWLRLAPLLAAAAVAFAAGIVVGAGDDDPRRATARDFTTAWAHGDYAAMHALLTPAAQRDVPLERFANAYRRAAEVSTLSGLAAAAPAAPDRTGLVRVPVTARTRVFGTITAPVDLPMEADDGGARVQWQPHLVFPGLREGEKLRRSTRVARRAALQARDGTVLAEGATRTGAAGVAAADIVGTVGTAPAERRPELRRRGVPLDTPVGLTGLEREFDAELTGTPGGRLRAGDRFLASVEPRPGTDVRTTIDLELQAAAVTALAGRFGGIAVLRPRDGEVLALAGIAYSAPQPPGSVFKIITLAGALEAGTVKPSDSWPVQQAAVLEGVELENANGEFCGGRLRNTFAHSCNSVFAPIGAELGAEKLVATAERFGFNRPPSLTGAEMSTIPPADEIGDDLAVGSTAIGQGRVLATPLEFATVAATIAERGMRPEPTLRKGAPPVRERVVPEDVARRIGSYMRSVVRSGTGTAAALPDVKVAGKTGTAELRDTTPEPDPITGEVPISDASDTNAWFAAYAPARRPRLAVAVMLVGAGAGGATAAPAARVVLDAGT